jgi:hypothetical protein
VFVEDESQIAEGDVVTIKVTVTRLNVPEGEEAPLVHCPYFPGSREEGLWFIVGFNKQVRSVTWCCIQTWASMAVSLGAAYNTDKTDAVFFVVVSVSADRVDGEGDEPPADLQPRAQVLRPGYAIIRKQANQPRVATPISISDSRGALQVPMGLPVLTWLRMLFARC